MTQLSHVKRGVLCELHRVGLWILEFPKLVYSGFKSSKASRGARPTEPSTASGAQHGRSPSAMSSSRARGPAKVRVVRHVGEEREVLTTWVPPDYTFTQLLTDAATYWGVAPAEHQLEVRLAVPGINHAWPDLPFPQSPPTPLAAPRACVRPQAESHELRRHPRTAQSLPFLTPLEWCPPRHLPLRHLASASPVCSFGGNQ